MKEFTLLSPAKINLNLHVTGVRTDGFHDIKSTVQPVGIFDKVGVRVSAEPGKIVVAGCEGAPEKNTAFVAANLFLQKAEIKCGVEISLKKNIPSGAGLGGGSGNAAAVLVGLNRVFGAFDSETLREIAGMVGSDVPLFIDCKACEISGRGEKVKPIEGFPLLNYVVCFPGFESLTADVYRKWDELNPSGKQRENSKKMWGVSCPVEMVNALEAAAFSLYPELARFCALISADYGIPVLMTGSGSSFFSVFEDEETAREVFERIKKEADFDCFLTRGIEGWGGVE
ncbi:4-(cytidine 5'-diphospho)-2-C-methyl-D-erythritol kinase [Candidatus Mycalebacterium sp.]